jgi:hypothetical protein
MPCVGTGTGTGTGAGSGSGDGAEQADFTYVGCYTDYTNEVRDLPVGKGDSLSLAECAAACNGHLYFGRQHTQQCFCGNSYGSQGTAEGCQCEASNIGGGKNCVYQFKAGFKALPDSYHCVFVDVNFTLELNALLVSSFLYAAVGETFTDEIAMALGYISSPPTNSTMSLSEVRTQWAAEGKIHCTAPPLMFTVHHDPTCASAPVTTAVFSGEYPDLLTCVPNHHDERGDIYAIVNCTEKRLAWYSDSSCTAQDAQTTGAGWPFAEEEFAKFLNGECAYSELHEEYVRLSHGVGALCQSRYTPMVFSDAMCASHDGDGPSFEQDAMDPHCFTLGSATVEGPSMKAVCKDGKVVVSLFSTKDVMGKVPCSSPGPAGNVVQDEHWMDGLSPETAVDFFTGACVAVAADVLLEGEPIGKILYTKMDKPLPIGSFPCCGATNCPQATTANTTTPTTDQASVLCNTDGPFHADSPIGEGYLIQVQCVGVSEQNCSQLGGNVEASGCLFKQNGGVTAVTPELCTGIGGTVGKSWTCQEWSDENLANSDRHNILMGYGCCAMPIAAEPVLRCSDAKVFLMDAAFGNYSYTMIVAPGQLKNVDWLPACFPSATSNLGTMEFLECD